jgi:hypothetical protein
MTTLTVNIDNKKTEKALKAVLDALDLDYSIEHSKKQPLNKADQVLFDRLKKSAKEIKLYKEGKIKLQDATEFLDEL